MEEEILYAGEKRRALKIIKVCDKCGRKYHPRSNGYELMSRFCSKECSKGKTQP